MGFIAPERRHSLFRLYVAWASRESDCKVLLIDVDRSRGPLCMNAGEVMDTAVRLGWLAPKADNAARARIWDWYCRDQDVISKVAAAYAVRLLEDAGWNTRNGMLRHCGTHPNERTRSRYLPRIMFLYADLWDEPMPLTVLLDPV